jgi:hypothetical protein
MPLWLKAVFLTTMDIEGISWSNALSVKTRRMTKSAIEVQQRHSQSKAAACGLQNENLQTPDYSAILTT